MITTETIQVLHKYGFKLILDKIDGATKLTWKSDRLDLEIPAGATEIMAEKLIKLKIFL